MMHGVGVRGGVRTGKRTPDKWTTGDFGLISAQGSGQ